MAHISFTNEQQRQMLALARSAIAAQFHPREVIKPDECFWLQSERACFVTLKINGRLRGCIGSLHTSRTLQEDLWQNAHAAAFSDPRFPPLTEQELEQVRLELSVLTELQPLNVTSEAELLSRLRPGVDGLVIEDGLRKATFLPTVWEQLPEPAAFLEQLRLKAGMPAGHWSETIQCSIYQVEKISEPG